MRAGRFLASLLRMGARRFRARFGYRSILFERLIRGRRLEAFSFGLNQIDLKLTKIIDTNPSYYIEIGANDGVSQSNTLILELCFGWRGLLVEPSKSTFTKLKKNRSARRNALVRAACVGIDRSQESVQLIYSNLMSVAVDLDNDIPDVVQHAKQGARFLQSPDLISIESVPALTLTQALDLAGAPRKVGLLSLDVEGAELEVLKGIDFDRYSIDWILVEARNFARIKSFLVQYGYESRGALSIHDYLFKRLEPDCRGRGKCIVRDSAQCQGLGCDD